MIGCEQCKSVFTDDDAFRGTGIAMNGTNDSFLVALSAIASNTSVTGMSNAPTDTMLILDLSSSMYTNNGYKHPTIVQTMLKSVNSTIEKLQKLNINNRVGVVVYFGGGDYLASKPTCSNILLPLDRYTPGTNEEYPYLQTTLESDGQLESVTVTNGVKNSADKAVTGSHFVSLVAGTYMQLGILDAMNQLLAADTTIPATAPWQAGETRVPVFMLMSDGEPTAATANYTKKETAGMGNNTVSFRNPAETDFVTQLTASYAKEMVDLHYADTEPIFYTLSLGTDISLDVMDPKNNDKAMEGVRKNPNATSEQTIDAKTNKTINGYWDTLLKSNTVQITVQNCKDQWISDKVDKSYDVKRTTINGAAFPASTESKYYVDKHFEAKDASQLADAFDSIVKEINMQSKYYPTLVEGNEDVSGYISFVDKIGKYMSVTDIKGILIDNQLFSGAELAANFVDGGGKLGTYDNPSALGDEMVWAVQQRLGLATIDEARTLIGLAYANGQLSYNETTGEFSNYIGWYANAAGEYLGFWHEGITTMPDPLDSTLTDDTRPAFIIKSYGYLGAVDESHGVAASDMMYATVQIRYNIATGEESVILAIPAALVPVVSYDVTLDTNNDIEKLEVTGAEHPIRLVYEVALDPRINELTVLNPDVVDADYVEENTDSDGKVLFYTNQYEVDNTTGYDKVNTYSYFRPSHQNEKYYYQENATVYTDKSGTKYSGSAAPDAAGTYYRSFTVYSKNGSLKKTTVYKQLSEESLKSALPKGDGTWYISAGNVHVNLDNFTVDKTTNRTETLDIVNEPFVDVHNHNVNEINHRFVVGATLGNNGRLAIVPATGLKLSKTLDSNEEDNNTAFEFKITSDTSENKAYGARKIAADGTATDTTVTFANGVAHVSLKSGEIMYITGMTAGKTYTVTEVPLEEYVVASVNNDPAKTQAVVTLSDGKLSDVNFVNTTRGTGDLVISKYIEHDLGADYTIPADKKFTMDVTLTLNDAVLANRTFKAESTDGSINSITTDANGKFAVTLGHRYQLEIFDLPEETVASVVERDYSGSRFKPTYYGNNAKDQNTVEIDKNAVATVEVVNTYTPAAAPAAIIVSGTKYVKDVEGNSAWKTGYNFKMTLQKYDTVNNQWVDVASDTVSAGDADTSFSLDMSEQIFDKPGTYSYQVIEEIPADEYKMEHILYDRTYHTFSVIVWKCNV